MPLLKEAPRAAPAPVPPEWATHAALWTAWPSHANLWQENLAAAQDEVEALVRALAGAGETVRVLACNGRAVIEAAKARLGEVAEVVPLPFGDIWLRDTGPIFGVDAIGRKTANLFRFNGWGGKYVLQNDANVGAKLAGLTKAKAIKHDFILEGGSVEMDGTGLCLTTRQCLLNNNRNPGWTQARIETALRDSLGVNKILWLDEGLMGDHTDGHIDNIARFVAPGMVVCQAPNGDDDPNTLVLFAIAEALKKMTDNAGKPLQVVTIPSPGRVTDSEGEVVAASHANFLIGNGVVVVPEYNARAAEAVAALQPHFAGRQVVALSSRAILSGGGSFHCITQQQPE